MSALARQCPAGALFANSREHRCVYVRYRCQVYVKAVGDAREREVRPNVELPNGVFWLDKQASNHDVVYGQVHISSALLMLLAVYLASGLLSLKGQQHAFS